MMMPANYSVIAENEMTYVNGGALVDCLAPVMTAGGGKDGDAVAGPTWAQYSKNLVMIIGNAFVNSFLNTTLGTVFSNGYVFGDATAKIGSKLTDAWEAAAGRVSNPYLAAAAGFTGSALQVLGGLASIYALGAGAVGLDTKAAVITLA